MLKTAPAMTFLGTAHDLARWRPQVDRALRGEPIGFEDIADGIDEGRYWMFDNNAAFVVLEPQGRGQDMRVMILVGGGTQQGIEALEFVVSLWARQIGARKISALAREGFWRRIRNMGWKKARILIEKEI